MPPPPPQPEPARNLHSSLQFSPLNSSTSQRKRHVHLLETDRVGPQLLLLEPDRVTTSTAAKCLPP